MISVCSVAKVLLNRPEFTGSNTGLAFGTKFRMNLRRLLFFPGYGVTRAGLETEAAHLALFWIYLEANQRCTDQGRAVFFLDVAFVFMPEVADGREHRVGGRLPKSAMGHPYDVAA